MGGMGFIESHKAECMLSSLINTHLLMGARDNDVQKFFFASSACVYASSFQEKDTNYYLEEHMAYPADPEDGYGWEKLFSERMCRHFYEDFGLDVRIARFHNIYGPFGTYYGGREKVPAAACRKILEYLNGSNTSIEIWGNGEQLRSFTYIEDCIEGVLKLMNSDFREPLNIGSSSIITIRALYDLVCNIAGVSEPDYTFKFDAPKGVHGRSSDNTLCRKILEWEPEIQINYGMTQTFNWIKKNF